MNLNIFIILILVLCANRSWSQLSCMDEYNKPVDWFIALKFPVSYNFVYLTPSISNWKLSSSDLSAPNNMVGLTLRQSYNKEFFYAYYNDAPPNSWPNSERGHSKGVLNFDRSSGYWLIHSVPKFPPEGSYEYLKGQRIFGQSFICVTVSTQNLYSIAQQLLMMQSNVYSHHLPEAFSKNETLMNALYNIVLSKNIETPESNSLHLLSSAQVSLIHFGKSKRFNRDLYADLIAPSLKTSIFVETWIRQSPLNSSCGKYKVFNVQTVRLVDNIFSRTKDHSKWAISTSITKPYICIGDINRKSTQFRRGGGSMCLSNADIWKTFRNIVYDYEHCDKGWVVRERTGL